jgi:hypothetical protein
MTEFVQKLKKKAKPLSLDKWTVTIMQKLATLLHPKYMSLLILQLWYVSLPTAQHNIPEDK